MTEGGRKNGFRRTFAAITMLMAIILFLFQGLNLAKEKLNHYEKNAYAAEKEDLEDGSGSIWNRRQHPARKT